MNIKVFTNGKNWVINDVDIVDIVLDNSNELEIIEVESGSINLKNVTHIPAKDDWLGLRIYPVDYSSIEITPEG